MAKKSKLRENLLSSLSSFLDIFHYGNPSGDELLMQKTNPNDPSSVIEVMKAMLVPSFNRDSLEAQRRYLDCLEILLKDETEDFSEIFDDYLQEGVFFGEKLTKTRQFVEIAYELIKKEYEKNLAKSKEESS